MNNIFNISRFANLFKKQTAEHYKTYLMSLVVLMGLILIFSSFFVVMERDEKDLINESTQFGIFMIIMMISGTIFTSSIFSDLGENRKAIATLTLPASHFEKFLVKWLYSYLLFLVVYTCIFYAVMIPVQSTTVTATHKMVLFNLFRPDNFKVVFISYTLAHAITLLGAIVFKKQHFIKTCFVMIGIFIVFVTANKWIMQSMVDRKIEGAFPFINFNFIENTHTAFGNTSTGYDITLHDNASNMWAYALVAVFTLLFWAAAYSRLKEKQV